ncbi:MAG: GIY-YIG nuclease family protein [Patescibacteria group bacterium]|nr:GIY-YIG nuclease family protein [Patescibacteria group bacterium]
MFNSDGLLAGHYVYSLICEEGGPYYIKIGNTNNPIKRLANILNGCPVIPRSLCYVELPTRRVALAIERLMQDDCRKWHQTLEWFRVEPAEFPEFRQACNAILKAAGEKGRPPLQWTTINVRELVSAGQRRQWGWRRAVARRGKPYKDFLRDVRRLG